MGRGRTLPTERDSRERNEAVLQRVRCLSPSLSHPYECVILTSQILKEYTSGT